jgi:hypothetical protein
MGVFLIAFAIYLLWMLVQDWSPESLSYEVDKYKDKFMVSILQIRELAGGRRDGIALLVFANYITTSTFITLAMFYLGNTLYTYLAIIFFGTQLFDELVVLYFFKSIKEIANIKTYGISILKGSLAFTYIFLLLSIALLLFKIFGL